MENERFSEFSYGFALTDELIHWHGTPLTAAPIFPSLQKEGQPGGGYDVQLPGIPLFLQFKLSHRMERNSATEVREGYPLSPYFYRMYLRPRNRSQQHNLLLSLEARGNLVLYATPAFFELEELNVAYRAHQVVQRSAFFRPSAIGRMNDDQKHHVSFQDSNAACGYLFSEPEERKEVEVTRGDVLSAEVTRKLKARGDHPITDRDFHDWATQMLEVVTTAEAKIEERLRASLEETARVLKPSQQVAYFSRALFDSTFFIVQSKGKTI